MIKNNTINSKTLSTLPIDIEQFYVDAPPYYQGQTNNLDYLNAHMNQDNPTPLCFVGPKGTGKTLVIAHFAAENNIPLIQYDCSENTRKGDLIGRYVLRGDETAYQLGVLPTAIEIANEVKTCILVLEELNALAPNMQKQLNQLLDWRRHVFADNGKTYRLNKGAKLLVCATMNPSTYGGVFELNEDLISRWGQVWVDYPTQKEEQSIAQINGFDEKLLPIITIKHQTKAKNHDYTPGTGSQQGIKLYKKPSNPITNQTTYPITKEMVWRLVYETRTENGLSYAISPRDVVQFLQGYQNYLITCIKPQAKKLGITNFENKSKKEIQNKLISKDFQDSKHGNRKLDSYSNSLEEKLNTITSNTKNQNLSQEIIFQLWQDASTNAFKMALYAFIIGKYQDTTEKETIKQRISSVFGDAVLNA